MTRRLAVSMLALLLLSPRFAAGQGTCQVNNQNSCILTGASYAISVTVTAAIRLTTASSTVTIPAPNDASYDAGSTTGVALAYQIRSNTNWTVSISSSAATWTASPASARQDKPQTDLQWSTALAGTYTDVTGTPTNVDTGVATAGSFRNVFLRSKLSWALDRDGTYQIPVVLSITAP